MCSSAASYETMVLWPHRIYPIFLTVPFFATGLGVGGPLQISNDCSAIQQNSIEVDNFSWGYFGINSPVNFEGSVVIGKSGQANITCANASGCIAAVGCGSSGLTTINIMTSAPRLIVFGTPNPNIVMIFNIAVETSVNITGIKSGDFIDLPRACNTSAIGPSNGTNIGYNDEPIKIIGQISTGGQLVCIKCLDDGGRAIHSMVIYPYTEGHCHP